MTAFCELEDIINKSQLAKQYFGRSQSWFSQRLNGCWVLNKSMSFKENNTTNSLTLSGTSPNVYKRTLMR